jgi:hypothetical protein
MPLPHHSGHRREPTNPNSTSEAAKRTVDSASMSLCRGHRRDGGFIEVRGVEFVEGGGRLEGSRGRCKGMEGGREIHSRLSCARVNVLGAVVDAR